MNREQNALRGYVWQSRSFSHTGQTSLIRRLGARCSPGHVAVTPLESLSL